MYRLQSLVPGSHLEKLGVKISAYSAFKWISSVAFVVE